jgi:putative restriction endonuclease
MALALYRALPFGRMDMRNAEVIALAQALGRTPASVALKLVNFASFDPDLQERGIKGMANSGRGDRLTWDVYANDLDKLASESERILASWESEAPQLAAQDQETLPIPKGREREAVVRIRIGQNIFRDSVLRAYDFRCCISGLAVKELLNASHIIPWSVNPMERLNPRNGLCLNATLDRAFDRGLITVMTDGRVRVSADLTTVPESPALRASILRYDGEKITPSARFAPEVRFLSYHNSERFRG